MDDLTFRKRIYADPNDNSEDIIKSCQENESHRYTKQQMQAFDKQLEQVLAVTPPENLTERILLNQNLAADKKHHSKRKVYLSLAASVFVSVLVAGQWLLSSPSHTNLAEHAMAHYLDETDHLHENDIYSLTQVNNKLAHFGGSIAEHIGKISFANFCRFDSVRSLHLVMETEQGPVTVFVMPKNTPFHIDKQFSQGQHRGIAIEDNNADMVIIADEKIDLTPWKHKLQHAIVWQKA